MKCNQVHLSTLLIVSLLAGGLVWLNVVTDTFWVNPYRIGRGWPLMFQSWWTKRQSWWGDGHVPPSYDFDALIVDIAVCLALLITAAAAIEWATRRMKRKPLP